MALTLLAFSSEAPGYPVNTDVATIFMSTFRIITYHGERKTYAFKTWIPFNLESYRRGFVIVGIIGREL
jgi:hypothetical protein